MDTLSSQIIIDILNVRMAMPADRIWLRNQNKLIPNDNDLFLVVGIVNAPVIMANKSSIKPTTAPTNFDQSNTFWDAIPTQYWDKITAIEVTEVQQKEIVQVDIASRNNDAISRFWEVYAAMQSIYAQQKMEANNFKIFRPSNVIDTSGAEGGSNLNRYTISIPCIVWYRKETALIPPGDYYNDFHQRVDDENTIGTDKPLIQFEINSGGIVS